MRTATLYRYSVPMEAGVILRHQRLKSRDGLLVKLQQGELSGWGEIAPLPEFSQETLDQAQVAAECWLQHWVSGVESDDSVLPSVALVSVVRRPNSSKPYRCQRIIAKRHCVPAILMSCLRYSRHCRVRRLPR